MVMKRKKTDRDPFPLHNLLVAACCLLTKVSHILVRNAFSKDVSVAGGCLLSADPLDTSCPLPAWSQLQ